jgi:hypothetical protein
MADDQLGMTYGHGCAIARFADALLRSMGGTQVTLRLSDPASGDISSQLGLEAPTAADMQISPAAVRSIDPTEDGKRRIEVLLSASALRVVATIYGIEDVTAWLLSMQGVLHHGIVLRIAAVKVQEFHGKECLYQLTATE